MRRLLLLAALLVAGPALAANVSTTRAVPQVELGALPVDLAPLAARLQSAIPSVRALDLSVPAPNAGVPAGPAVAAAPADARVVPAAYATERAQALLGRLAAAGAADLRKPVEAAAPADAKKTIAAVNAMLKDFTPEQLAALPQEKLAALSSALFDHMDARAGAATSPAAAAVLAQASAERMLAQRGRPLREVLLNPGHNDMHPDDIEVHGVPAGLKPVDSSGVWRHYTTKEGYEAILKSGALQNGYVAYVQLSPGLYKKIFKDVGGLFLTKPGVEGDAVGVPKSDFPHYVDVVLPAAMTVLELEAGKIWLVPLPGRTRGWIADLYRRWAETGQVDTTYRKALVDVDAAGGAGPDLAVPVTIVKKGKTQ